MTFNEAAEMYFDTKAGLIKPSSLSSAQRLYRGHIAEYLGDMDLDDVNSRIMQKFYNYASQKKSTRCPNETLSEKTVKDIVGLAKTIYYNAVAEGEAHECSFRTKKPYGMKQADNGQAAYLDERDCEKIMASCTDGNYKKYGNAKIMALLAITTGMRIGEICGLTWEDVDFVKGIIRVRRTVQRICPVDGKSYINIGPPKTETSKRDVIILDIARQALMACKKCSKIEDDRFFVIGGSKPTEPRTLRQTYGRFLRHVGVEYIHPHALRHTFCTYSISNGCDVKTVSMLLGHSKTDITLNTYTHIMQKQLEKTKTTLNGMFTAQMDGGVE